MFIGHYALAFGGKRAAPTVSLGTLFAACQFADLLWPTLVLLGVERVAIDPGNTAVTPLEFISYPYSHSLEMLVVWGLLFGLAYRVMRRSTTPAAVTIAALVVSHWVLDWISHGPDLPLTVHRTARVGLGLWNSIPATVGVEGLLFAVGVGVYARSTRARDRIGSLGLWSLVAFLVMVSAANLMGPPPPSVTALAWAAQSMWVIVLWGDWIDRHRDARA
jgi:hypothetical protein